MSKFLFVYHGGKMPESQEEAQQVMAAWESWLGGMGDAVVDGGNPVGMSSTVHSDGRVSDDGGANPASGYSIVSAESVEQAQALAQGCPIREAGGAIEIAPIMEM